jgi:AbrB family looped-hinge helix DNA binding protein
MKTLYSRISTKGQVVIPAELRTALELRAGTRVALQLEGTGIRLQPVTEAFIDSIPGSLNGPSLGKLRKRQHRDDKR